MNLSVVLSNMSIGLDSIWQNHRQMTPNTESANESQLSKTPFTKNDDHSATTTTFYILNQSTTTLMIPITADQQTSNNFKTFEGLVLTLVLVLLILATIVGNVFVISAVILERTLRTVGNYLVLSLAATDLMVACLVMPPGVIYKIHDEWRLGVKLCELWTFTDVLCCTASIFHLLAIACDRFWAVTTVDYIHRRKPKHICLGIALIWLLSGLISLGPMLGWKDDDFERRILEDKQCMVSQAVSYQIIATIFSFYAPSILLLLLYYRIYQVAKTRILLKKRRCKHRIYRKPSCYGQPKAEIDLKKRPSCSKLNNNNNNNQSSGNSNDPNKSDHQFFNHYHRASINPNEEFYSSSGVVGAFSTSGIYSSSTNTDYTSFTNTSGSMIHSKSLSPPTMNRLQQSLLTDNSTGCQLKSPINNEVRRVSVQKLLSACQQQKLKQPNELSEEFMLKNLTGHDFKSNEMTSSSVDDTTITVALFQKIPTSIVVFVDDYGSKINQNYEIPDESYEDDVGISIDEQSNYYNSTSCQLTDSPVKTESERSTTASISVCQNGQLSKISKNFTESGKNIQVTNDIRCCFTFGDKSKRTAKKQRKHKKNRIKRKMNFCNKLLLLNSGGESSKKESKAAKTLTIITGIFIICWLPFFVLALILPLCKNCIISKFVFDFCLWLGWANSTMNPLLYTIFSPDFRNAFNKLIFGRRRRRIKKKP